jgi:cytochrome P450
VALAQRTEVRGSGAELPPSSDVPGPPGPRLAQTIIGTVWPLRSRLAVRRRYGKLFRTDDAIVGPLVHVADRELAERIFKWKPAQYNVAEPREVMEPAVGRTSLLLLDGQPHLRMRKLMLPPFHGPAIARFAELITEITEREIDGWRVGDRIRTRSVAQRITMEVIIRTVFGVTDPERLAEMQRLLPGLSSINPFVLFVQRDLGPLSPWGRFLRRRERVDELIYEAIRERRGADEQPDDILSLLLAARDEDGAPLSDRELRDELITILLAGHETTATSIGWAFERLLRTPAVLDRLVAEVESGEEEYLQSVVKETLRLRPVVTEVFRSPAEPVELGGYQFQPGEQLCVAMMLIQCDPEFYGPDPDAFRPERYAEGDPEPYAWIPFGGGVRRCIGAAFAELEMRVVIATILRRVELRAVRPRPERARFRGVTVLPSRGGEARVERIRGPS